MSQSFNEDPVFRRVKSALIKGSGMEGLKEAVDVFRSVDTNNDNEIDPKEWVVGLKRLGVRLTDQEAKYLFISFDLNKDGLISIDEFVRNLIGQLSPRRAEVVHKAFEKFQLATSSGPNVTLSGRPYESTVDKDELIRTFTATSNTHPLVASGAKSEAQLIKEFARIFDNNNKTTSKLSSTSNMNGSSSNNNTNNSSTFSVTKEAFAAYYAAVSTTVPHDDVFEAMVLKAWGIDDPTRPRLAATMRDWSSTNGGKDPLALEKPLLHTEALNATLGDTAKSKAYNSTHMARAPAPFTPNPSVLPDYISVTKRDFVPYDEQARLRADPMTTRRDNSGFAPTASMTRAAAKATTSGRGLGAVPLTGSPLVDGLRAKVLARKEDEGFAGLRRSFYVMGVGPTKPLQKLEARAALQRYKISVTPIEFEQIWNFVLREGPSTSTVITVADFISVLRGDSFNERRAAVVRAAFEFLLGVCSNSNNSNNDTLSLSALSQRFNANEYPSVRAGTRTAEGAVQDLVDSLGAGGERAGPAVDYGLFCDYYEDISANIEDDLAFELIVRNAWRMK